MNVDYFRESFGVADKMVTGRVVSNDSETRKNMVMNQIKEWVSAIRKE